MARYGSRHQAARRQPAPGTKLNVSTRMSAEAYAKALTMAEGLNISISALLNELVERQEVNASGVPDWESKYAPPSDDDQLELSA